ncbi:MAG: hypothetical protein ACXWDS_06135 [Actinomycetota bacterium]
MPWWERPGLEVRGGRLLVAGRDAETVARERGTPVFAHDLVRVEEQAGSLLGAFDRAGVPLRLRLGSPCTRARPTKFGILDEQLVDALEIAAKHDLAIDTIHAHVGDGFLSDGLPRLEVAIERVAAMTRRILDAGHHVVEVNAGGGLGVPQAAGERPLDVGAYADLLARHLGSLVGAIGCEPGDYLCKGSRACCSPRS